VPPTPTGPAACDPAKPALAERPLLSPDQAAELMGLFKILASDSRPRLLHALTRAGELCVSDLAATVAMTPQAVSNQLQRLVDRRIVAARRQASNVYYRLVDPCVPGLLDLGLCLLEDAGRLPQPDPVPAGVAG
jgi:ArsR family transcriptional regulator, lead/cadmium/zinc/bismuth-responsive transcriptional repressor